MALHRFILILFYSFIFIRSTAQDGKKMSVHVSILQDTSKLNILTECYDSSTTVLLKVQLTNCTHDTLSFSMTNCSRSYSFVSSEVSQSLCLETCTRNFPHVYKLASSASMDVILQLHRKNSTTTSFKLGFMLIEHPWNSKKDFYEILNDKLLAQDFIWSNDLYLR